MCVTLCGRFGPDEGGVAGYVDRIGTKSPAKWGVQMAGMNFQIHPRGCAPRRTPKPLPHLPHPTRTLYASTPSSTINSPPSAALVAS
ncbi:DUF6783 domain-containing protein [Enterocloster lavalensis]|uniref:DUF6783 domain-containing protein n=1 Tax=Enterocloster lavalensis TaxID=460384 RepID=UPI0027E1B18A|nr:DUF6783 domain-containing protein [Enterocloster lavalensis]